MTPEISERSFEDAIEAALLHGGPDAPGGGRTVQHEQLPVFGEGIPGGYHQRDPDEYEPHRCLIARDLFDFIYTSQPQEWERLKQHYGEDVKERFLVRLASEIEKRGTLDVLRRGVKDSGCKFALAHFHPSSGLNEELQLLYEANIFSVIRQLRYGTKKANENKSLDLAIFLNGLPIFTAELKNILTGQTVKSAISQYRRTRDPKEPLFRQGRCLAHFAVDPDLVYVTTHLQGRATEFLPFNLGKFGGAGNPPVMQGYATRYLWDRIWARDSVLNLIQHFIQEIELEDDRGRKTGRKVVVFPRYHQLDCVRRLITHARDTGPGHNYLILHSAGSGKSNSIAWLAHQLSVLHDREDRRIFDSIIVITDRRVLDRQLQRTVRQFEQTRGVVENIDTTSRQLKEALESGKTIIVTTLQKFPVIVEEIGALQGQRFAVIVDEAHSSQTGESTKSMKEVLAAESLEDAEAEEAVEVEDLEDRIVAEMQKRGRLENVSTFAFTATPKPKTLELFGTATPKGGFEAFSLYSMRQAIEEGFILDVLENYITYRTYWQLLKTIEDDPAYDRDKAVHQLKRFVDLHEHTVGKKVEVMVEHFAENVAHRINGRAKAMIVTRSRLHAVRYRLALDAYLNEQGYPFQALVAFSGSVRDGGKDYTETNMNGFPEKRTADQFDKPEHRFMVVAEKFQTGFDQPLLHTMYVDRRLAGVHAVQTLSRLNRIHPGKQGTIVFDFANETDEIQKAFQPYYEKTILSEGTDPNLLYEYQRRIDELHVFTQAEIDDVARVYYDPVATQDMLYGALSNIIERASALSDEEIAELRGRLKDYTRLYSFLSQILTFTDADLEKLHVIARLLWRYLPTRREELPVEIQQQVDMESYQLKGVFDGSISLKRGTAEVKPRQEEGTYDKPPEEIEPLSAIIRELNERFGTDFSEEDRVFIRQLEEMLAGDEALTTSVKVNTPENARLTFDHVVGDRLQDMIESNFEFYKRVTDDRDFASFFLEWLFDRFQRTVGD